MRLTVLRAAARGGRALSVAGALGVLAAAPAAHASGPPGWTVASPMSTARTLSAAAVLADGRVLVTGGQVATVSGAGVVTQSSTNVAELFDPATGRWQPTASMSTYRRKLGLVALADGRVLAVGGATSAKVRGASLTTGAPCPTPGCAGPVSEVAQWHLATAELYDPASQQWAPAGTMAAARIWPTTTLLRDGTVLVTGGGVSTAERFDPATEQWKPAGDTGAPRLRDTATLLADGRVLDCGGYDAQGAAIGSCALYDPATNAWVAVPGPPVPVADQTALRLADGRVLLVGGQTGSAQRATGAAQLWSPSTGRWRELTPISVPRASASAVLLPDHSALVCGGMDDGGNARTECDRLESTTGHWQHHPALHQGRFDFALVVTSVQRSTMVLATGGSVGWYDSLPGPIPNADVRPTASTETDLAHT